MYSYTSDLTFVRRSSSEIIMEPVKMKILEGYDQMFELVKDPKAYGGGEALKVIPKKLFKDARLIGNPSRFQWNIGNEAASSLLNEGSNLDFTYLYGLLLLIIALVVVLLLLFYWVHKKRQQYKLQNAGPLLLNSPNSSISSVEKGVLQGQPDRATALSNLSWKLPHKKKQAVVKGPTLDLIYLEKRDSISHGAERKIFLVVGVLSSIKILIMVWLDGNNPRAPAVDVYLQWIYEGWQSLTKEAIASSFKTCGITNAADGSEDDEIHCFKQHGPASGGRLLLKQARENTEIDALIPEEIDIEEDAGTVMKATSRWSGMLCNCLIFMFVRGIKFDSRVSVFL
uniref:Uncharacterized protein n=1 Tax=Ditylenchus dipsaci TaxID=166011 RepID=A0A915EKL6_9BILA